MLRGATGFLLRLLLAYSGGWTIAYFVIMRNDARYFSAYLRLAWTSPGEIPLVINLFALGIALLVTIFLEIWLRARRRRGTLPRHDET